MKNKHANSPKDIKYSIWETKTNQFPEFPVQNGEKSIEGADLEFDLKDKNE
ncbi:hypothetical protein [Neobacillus niacini]|uniref:hypothetical protein n=1 Tax=Neobacillus niacini TaxID=86668 RepID=UPI0021CB5730|nr:hypothetical protein [Neobacillus niacini]MCM3766076.1 hypothetical protein [Neobacillus niacini]